VEFHGDLGIDVVWLDLEHGGPDPWDAGRVEGLLRAAVANLDESLAVPELGFVSVGPFDLSVSLGHLGEIDYPEVQEAAETVRSTAIAAGVPVGGLGSGADDVNEKVSDGYQLLNLGSATGVFN